MNVDVAYTVEVVVQVCSFLVYPISISFGINVEYIRLTKFINVKYLNG